MNYKSEPLKKCVGDEYEELLYNLLRENEVCFETEVELRLQGKSKTPDALLLFPIGIKINELNNDWQIIHWIDSKGTLLKSSPSTSISNSLFTLFILAMFGDPTTYEQNLEQFQGYVNRFHLFFLFFLLFVLISFFFYLDMERVWLFFGMVMLMSLVNKIVVLLFLIGKFLKLSIL